MSLIKHSDLMTGVLLLSEAEYGEEKISYRALMVIKASNKTMAKQRKDAISNWKVCLFFYFLFFYQFVIIIYERIYKNCLPKSNKGLV